LDDEQINDAAPNDESAAPVPPQPEGSKYDVEQIRALEGIEGIRTRPSMYIGDTTGRGLHHLVFEVVDNSVDEAVGGFAQNIVVKINSDGSVSCSDDGRGIPVGPMPDMDNRSALEVVLTESTPAASSTAKGATRPAPADCTASASPPSTRSASG
jgi:hypothetical protein